MKTAHDKNLQAFATLFGDPALANYLCKRRIGIFSADGSSTKSGHLLAEALGDTLGRLWPTLDACGPLADIFLTAASSAAGSGKLPVVLNQRWSPPYDSVVVIGNAMVQDAGPVVRIGADGWLVTFGAKAALGASSLPVGPAAAAALAGAEVFKQVFATHLTDFGMTPLGDGEWNIWTLGESDELPTAREIVLPRSHMMGCGAVTHGLAWVLERWPEPVSGTALLIDHDSYDDGNGQRYAGMQLGDSGQLKVTVLAARLKLAHPELEVLPYPTGLNAFFDMHEPMPDVGIAVVGLDSAESRRQAALKLPRRSINMWTEGHALGSSRHGLGDGWPCLFCSYPETLSGQIDEAAVIAKQVGLEVFRVRVLLDHGGTLTPHEANLVAPRIGRTVNDVLERPLRTILQQVCATGHVPLREGKGDTDVPFAFSSLLAGVVGFRNMARELWCKSDPPTRWTYDILQRPSPWLLQPVAPKPNCYLCA